MGFGTLLTSAVDDASIMGFAASSPTQKRPLELDEHVILHEAEAGTSHKMAKVGDHGDDSPSSSTRAGSSPAASSGLLSSPAPSSGLCLSEEEAHAPVTGAPKLPSHHAGPAGLDIAVEQAMRIFTEAWVALTLERDAAKGEEEKREDYACKVCETMVADKYEEMKDALLNLLPWLGTIQPDAHGGMYHVVDFQGRQPPRQLLKSNAHLDEPELLKLELEWLRSEPRGRAWEACCAVMAALSTRSEKCWLEANDVCSDMEAYLSTLPGCKAKKSVRRKDEIRKFIEKESSHVRGFFAHYMVTSTTNMRIALVPGVPRPMPASLVITSRLPLWDALVSLDGDFPLRGEAKSRAWCLEAGRQFAFQLAHIGIPEKPASISRKARVAGADLQPDAKLRELIRSKKPVIQLEVVAGLAPRDISKKHGLSEIVKAELAAVTREAKRRGEAVVFCLGSDSPHILAEKVYMRAPIGDHGLQCGYLRWRESADAPWARETIWHDRTTLCLQMP